MHSAIIACPGCQLAQAAVGIQHQVVDGDERRIKHQQHRQLFHKRSAVKQQHKEEEQKHCAKQASRVVGVDNGVGQKAANQKRDHFQNQRLPKGKKGLQNQEENRRIPPMPAEKRGPRKGVSQKIPPIIGQPLPEFLSFWLADGNDFAGNQLDLQLLMPFTYGCPEKSGRWSGRISRSAPCRHNAG